MGQVGNLPAPAVSNASHMFIAHKSWLALRVARGKNAATLYGGDYFPAWCCRAKLLPGQRRPTISSSVVLAARIPYPVSPIPSALVRHRQIDDLGDLPARGVVAGLEVAIRVAGDDAALEGGFDGAVERVAPRHVGEVRPTCGIGGPAQRGHDDLAQLPAGHVV